MNLLSLTSASAAAKPPAEVPLEELAANKNLPEDQKIQEVSRQFEAIILRQILSQGRKTMFHSKMTEESSTSGIYQDMVTGQLADAISRNGSFGLARSLQVQLSHQ